VQGTPPPRKSRLAILGIVVLMVGLNTCMALIFLALGGVGGLLPLGPVLFGVGLVLTFIGMGILFLYLILHSLRKPVSSSNESDKGSLRNKPVITSAEF